VRDAPPARPAPGRPSPLSLAPPAARHLRLVASLPRLPAPFDPRAEPAGAVRLARRLEALSPAEARALAVIEAGFDRARLAGLADAEVLARARAAVAEAPEPAASALAAVWRLRGLAALALRRRAGATAPDPTVLALPGMAGLARRIRQGWLRPGFGLEGPLAAAARAAEETADPLAHWQAALLRESAVLRQAAFPPRFSFAAAVLYVLSWTLVVEARAASADHARARIARALEAAAAPVEEALAAPG